jgi:hypothetical protein
MKGQEGGTVIEQQAFGWVVDLVTYGSIVVGLLCLNVASWAESADDTRYGGTLDSAAWWRETGRIGLRRIYNYDLAVARNAEGLYLAVFHPERSAHQPMSIPWVELTITRIVYSGDPMVRIQIGRNLPVPFWIQESLVKRLEEGAGNTWPGSQP